MDFVALRACQLLRIAAGGWLAALCAISQRTIDSLPGLCLYRRFTGSPCPGCGLTHSVWFLLHGQMAAALDWNKLGIVVLPAAMVFAITGFPARRPRWRWRRWPTVLRIPRDQIRLAARWVWTVLTVVFALTLAAAAIVPESRLMGLAPVCERKLKTGRDCPLCGMTHAFVSISRGEFGAASRQNAGSLPLYAALFSNEWLFGWRLMRGRRPRSKQPSIAPREFKGEIKC
jgi:hypothetical protein